MHEETHKSGNAPMKIFLIVLCAVLLGGNIFFSTLFLRWRQSAQSYQRQNEELASDYKSLQSRFDSLQQADHELKQNVQAAINSQEVAGIFRKRDKNDSFHFFLIDLRSDGSGNYDRGYGAKEQPITWTNMENGTISIKRLGIFKIESQDLIDDSGERWLRIR